MRAIHTVVTTAEFARWRTKNNGKVLLVGGDPGLINSFRIQGGKAFGILTTDRPGTTRYHAVGDAGKLPVLSRAFQFVYWLEDNPGKTMALNELWDALQAVATDGLFIFNREDYPDWEVWLWKHSWERLPFRAGDYVLFQRPGNGNGKHTERLAETSA